MKKYRLIFLGTFIFNTFVWAGGYSIQVARESVFLESRAHDLLEKIAAEMIGYLNGFPDNDYGKLVRDTDDAARNLQRKIETLKQAKMDYTPSSTLEWGEWMEPQEVQNLTPSQDPSLHARLVAHYIQWIKEYGDLEASRVVPFIRIQMVQVGISIQKRLFFLLRYASEIVTWKICLEALKEYQEAAARRELSGDTPLEEKSVTANNKQIELSMLEMSGRAYDVWTKRITKQDEDVDSLLLPGEENSHKRIRQIKKRVLYPVLLPRDSIAQNGLFFECIRRNKEEYALSLLKEYPELRQKRTSAGYSPLSLASSYGLSKLVMALIEAGDKVLDRDVNGYTPLMAASAAGQVEVVKALLAHDDSVEHINATSLREGDTVEADESYEMVSSSSQSSSMQRSYSSYIKGLDALDFASSKTIRRLLEKALEKTTQASEAKLLSNA